MALSKKAKRALEETVERFKSGDLSPVVELAHIELESGAPAKEWTWSNRILAFAQTGDADVRGYNQWRDAGRHVRKGETAAYILIPRIVTVEDDDGEEERECRGFFGGAVFGLSQTDPDDESETVSYQPRELPPLVEVAGKLGVEVDYGPLAPFLGSTELDGSKIMVGSEDPAPFFHELAHAIHARLGAQLKGGQHADQETVAEFVSCVLMDLYEVDRSGNAWRYISQYCDDPLQAVIKAMRDVEAVLNLILETADETIEQVKDPERVPALS